MDVNKFLKTNLFQIIFLVLGALGGFFYWKFVGCENGTCAIKSVWYWSTLWGASVGYLVGDLLSGLLNKKIKNRGEQK